MSKKNSLQVIPNSILFKNASLGKKVSIDAWIRNLGAASARVRCSISKDSPFKLSTGGTMVVAPGLDVKISITYDAKDYQIYNGELIVETENSKNTVPIKAMPPSSLITANKYLIDLGKVVADEETKFTFQISNTGMKDGSFGIKCEDSNVSITPDIGSLLPNKTTEITCTYKPVNEGDFSFSIKITSPETIEGGKPIIVNGTAIRNLVSLLFDNKPISEFDFGTLYYGQKKVMRAKICNNGSSSRSYVIFPPQDHPLSAQSAISCLTQKANENTDFTFTTLPMEGLLEPYKSEVINFIFQPTPDNTTFEDEMEILYNSFTSIEIVETRQRLDLQFVGKAVHHSVELSCVDFDFQKCKPNTQTSKTLVITNKSQFLPTSFEIKPIAQFKFNPTKGQIAAGKQKEISIIFYPRNYGTFEFTPNIHFCDGLFKKPFNILGECCNPEQKPFKRKPIYETDKEVRFNALHPDKRFSYDLREIQQNTLKKMKFDQYITDFANKRKEAEEKKEIFQRSLREAKSQLQRTVGDYSKEELNALVQKKIQDYDNKMLDEISLGLAPAEGMKAPDPPLNKRQSPLFVLRPEKFGIIRDPRRSQTAFQSRKKLELDEASIPKKKYKQKPTTPQEINDCSKALTPAQQIQITTSTQIINFGNISVFSSASKIFAITNGLQQYILVTVQIEDEELSESSPLSQVIPPRSVAGFDIKFTSSRPKNFSTEIQYTINGKITNTFSVIGQVVPIDVQLSKSVLEFRFSADSSSPIIKEFISMTNSSIGPAQYSWTGMNDFFSISATSGTIEPGKVHNLEITYTPTNHSHDETTLVASIVGGEPKSIRCIGDVGNPKVSVSKKTVAFGLIPIGILKTQIVRLKNSGEDDALFSIRHGNLSEISITPESGRVSGHSGLNLTINVNSVNDRLINVPVTVSIAGAQPISFNITARPEFPKVQLQNSEFDFGKLFVGSSASLPATLINNGSIPAILFLDLSMQPQFHIEFSTDLADNGDNENSISIVHDTVFVTRSETKHLSESSSQLFNIGAINNESSKNIAQNANKGLIYKISLIENSTITFNLVYEPTEVGDHSFELPITMMNATSFTSYHLQPIVSGEAIQAPISLSENVIDFQIAPLIDRTNPHSRAVVRQITVKNDEKCSVHWRFDTTHDYCKNDIFSFEPSCGLIESGQSKIVHIYFYPSEAISYYMNLPIYATSDKEENLIGHLQITGVGSKLLYRMSMNHVCLPIVPLNVKSEFNLFVLNEGFIETELNVQMPVDDANFPIQVIFPEGQKLEHAIEKLPVTLSFESPKPICFSTVIALTDSFGGAISFEVTCTADNSIFTLYPYFYDKEMILSAGSGKPITYEIEEPCTKPNELTSRLLNASDILDFHEINDENWLPTCSPVMISFVQRYFNALIMSTQLSEFPKDFIQNDFSLWIEAIHNMTNGKKIPYELDRNSASNDPLTRKVETAQKYIRFLESFGALLSSVKPEFLLSKADFIQFMRNKISKQLIGMNRNSPIHQQIKKQHQTEGDTDEIDQALLEEFIKSKAYSDGLLKRLKVYEDLYSALSTESWMMVLMQMIKVFAINKIDLDRFSKTLGISNVKKSLDILASNTFAEKEILNEVVRPNKSINASNVFSTSECLILKWISLYFCNITNDLNHVVISFDELKDGIALSALIKSHSPSSNIIVNDQAHDKLSCESNAIAITTAMKDLKLGFSPKQTEITQGSSCTLAMIAAYLFETLPHFLPYSIIEFQTHLHKVLQKTVTITNTSKTEIQYTAHLEANNNFTLSTNNFILGPNEMFEFPITFSSRTLRPVSGKLTFRPSKPKVVNSNTSASQSPRQDSSGSVHMPIFSAPIVMELQSNVTINKPDDTYTMEGVLYQPTKQTIVVRNLIGVPSNVTILTRITQLSNELGEKINQEKSLQEQMIDFIRNPHSEELQSAEEDTPFDKYLKNHKMFVFNHKQIEFQNGDDEVEIEVEFIPISLGEFRCLVLFLDESKGEFITEIIAKSINPEPTEIATNKMKTEANKYISYSIPLEQINTNLTKALAYSIEKYLSIDTKMTERKFKDLTIRRQHECESLFRQRFSSQIFSVNNSSPSFYDVPNEVTLVKIQPGSSPSRDVKDGTNSIPIVFKPTRAGDYPCKLLLISKYDTRLISFKGIGLLETKELFVEFNTVIGKSVDQEIPLQNPSNDSWTFKTSISGDNCFNAHRSVIVKPKTTGSLIVTFTPNHIGDAQGELSIYNQNKEATVIYKLKGNVDEPQAEDKIIVQCQARQISREKIIVKSNLIKGSNIKVTSTLPIIKFNPEFSFSQEGSSQAFHYSIYAPRSGITAGIITFTDTQTKNYVWYVVEIHVDTPPPEQVIDITTEARKCATVKIPIANPKAEPVNFTVILSDDDLFGDKTFVAAAKTTTDYSLVVSPLKATKRTSSIFFYSDDDGEFWYSLNIEVVEPPASKLAPIFSPLGKSSSTFIDIENPIDSPITFNVTNDNTIAFRVLSKPTVQLGPNEKKKIEVRYLPTTVGVKEYATIIFKSDQIGDWVYELIGTGKPPQPHSPIIVASNVSSTSSALALFSNPFPYSSRFSITLKSDGEQGIFSFLTKRKIFTLNSFGDEFQIPFSFSPNEVGHFKGSIVVAYLGPAKGPLPNLPPVSTSTSPSGTSFSTPATLSSRQAYSSQSVSRNNNSLIQWIFPIIGNSVSGSTDAVYQIKCHAHDTIETTMKFSLVGENEVFNANDYSLKPELPEEDSFIRYSFEITPTNILRSKAVELVTSIKFSPKRPCHSVFPFRIKNPIGQEWVFQLELRVDQGKPTAVIQIESLLNKTGTAKVSIPLIIREPTPFHAYFIQGSAQEFSAIPEHGFIQPAFTLSNCETELPLTVIFSPKMYGKVLKGTLVIDTLDTQFIFQVVGKTPEYVPPIIQDGTSQSRLDNVIKAEDIVRMQPKRDKRQIIRDNIEMAKRPHITSPMINNRR